MGRSAGRVFKEEVRDRLPGGVQRRLDKTIKSVAKATRGFRGGIEPRGRAATERLRRRAARLVGR